MLTPTTHLYNALNQYLRQSDLWRDIRHLQTLCWMMIGMIESEKVHPSGFGIYVKSRAQKSQSHQRRFRRWLANRRINVRGVYHQLIAQALSQWEEERLYLSLDTTMLWQCFCVVWVGVVYRGRTIPLNFRILVHNSSTVGLRPIQQVLQPVTQLLPPRTQVVLLADRGFADGKLMHYLQRQLRWHFRIRIKQQFQFQSEGQWYRVADVQPKRGKAYFTGPVYLGKTRPYGPVYLAFAQDKRSEERWVIVSDEPTSQQTFEEYRLRFQVEETFLDLKSNGFQLEASRLRDKFALGQLLWGVALTMLFLVLQGSAIVAQGKRQQVDPHWRRGMSYLKIGWNWIRRAITEQSPIPVFHYLSSDPDPEPAIASQRQHQRSFSPKLTVLKHLPAS